LKIIILEKLAKLIFITNKVKNNYFKMIKGEKILLTLSKEDEQLNIDVAGVKRLVEVLYA
jgi:hypothetical protein